MSFLGKIVPLILLFVGLAVATFIGYAAYTIATDIAAKTSQKMEKKNVKFGREGMKIGIKELKTENYVDQTQSLLVKAWNYSTWPAYKSRLWNKENRDPSGNPTTAIDNAVNLVSIIFGVIIIVTTVNQVIKSAEKLRSSLKANDQIYVLINDLTNLKCVLTAVNTDQSHLSAERGTHPQNIIKRANEKLSELNLMINSRLLKAECDATTSVPDRIAWVLEKGRLGSIQKELRYLTNAFSLALTTSTSSGMTRVELLVTALATSTERSSLVDRTFRGIDESRFDQLHQAMESLIMQTTDLRDIVKLRGRMDDDLVEKKNPTSRSPHERGLSRCTKISSTSKADASGWDNMKIQATRASYRKWLRWTNATALAMLEDGCDRLLFSTVSWE